MLSSPAVNKTMYKIAMFGSQQGLRFECLQSHDKEFGRKMRGLTCNCCACNYTMIAEGTYAWVPLQKFNSEVDLDIGQKSCEVLLKSTFVLTRGIIF